jgi:hypothetical protein
MCAAILPRKKQQPIDGFPKGWYLYFEPSDPPPKSRGSRSGSDVYSEMRIVASWGGTYKSLQSLRRKHQSRVDDILDRVQSLYDQVGTRLLVQEEDNIMLGKGFSREWTNVDGQKRHVSGVITNVESDLHTFYFTVTYDVVSRNLVNALLSNNCSSSNSSSCCLYVPDTETFLEPDVLGGHLLDNQKLGVVDSSQWMQQFAVSPFYISWLVPDLRHEVLCPDENDDGAFLPVLTMVVRGFQIVFTAKTSSIPNAGNGVFVTCTALRGKTMFELAPGELLDMGVYAPYRSQDRRKDHIWLLKNFVHRLKCEEFGFGMFLLCR